MFLGGGRVLVTMLVMLVRGLGVILRVLVLAHVMEMGGLEVVMGRRLMMGGRLVMMFARRTFLLRHDVAPLEFSGEPHPTAVSVWRRFPSRRSTWRLAGRRSETSRCARYRRVTAVRQSARTDAPVPPARGGVHTLIGIST